MYDLLNKSFREVFVLGKDVTDENLRECAIVFSTCYGTWSEHAKTNNPMSKAGAAIKMSYKLLRKQCVFDPEHTYLARVYCGNDLCGYAFAASWHYPGIGEICWVTQLVTSSKYRCLGVASRNLMQLHNQKFVMYGLVSSHIAACITLAKCLGTFPIDLLDLDFVKQHAKNIIDSTPIQYLKESKLHGSLFSDVDDSTVSSVNSNFFTDHTKVLEYLNEYLRLGRHWPLGALLEGHEFFIVVVAKPKYE